MNELNINLIGSVEFKYNDERLEHKLSNKAIALISILMLDMGKQISREKLISYLWADSDEEAARYNLRYNLWNIKKIIPTDDYGQELIISQRECCLINPKYKFKADILTLMQAEVKGNNNSLEELNVYKELFRGDFLEGIYIKNCDEFNEKIIFERIVYQNKYVTLLSNIAEKYETYKNYMECIGVLNELVGIEPYNEKFAYKLMCAYIVCEQVSEAINYYKKFESTLRSNLNILPGSELKLLYGKVVGEAQGTIHRSQPNDRVMKQDVAIEIICIKDIDYFSMSEIIRKLLLKCDKKYIFGFNKCYLDDLNFIQLEIGLGYEKMHTDKYVLHPMLPMVRIVNAFVKFISYMSEIYKLQIKITNSESMDYISANTINYIKQMPVKDLDLILNETDNC